MKHKKSSSSDDNLGTKVYSFAAYVDKSELPRVRELCFQYNRVYNAFIEIERKAILDFRAARLSLSSELEEAERRVSLAKEKVDTFRGELKRARGLSRERNSKGGRPDLSYIEVAKAELRSAKVAVKEIRDRLKTDPELTKAVDIINKAKRDSIAGVSRAFSSVYWLIREQAQQSADLATKASIKASKEGKHWRRQPEEAGLPRFNRFDGSGRLAIRHTAGTPGGVPLRALLACNNDSLFQMSELPDNAFVLRGGKEKPIRSLTRTSAKIRVGSDNRAPIWFPFTFIQHRKLPLDSKVTSVSLVCSGGEGRPEFLVQFSVSAPANKRPAVGSKTLILSVERKLTSDRGLLVAKANEPGLDVVLPPDLIDAIEHSDAIKSARDSVLNLALEKLTEAKSSGDLPESALDMFTHSEQWRSHRRVIWSARKLCEMLGVDSAGMWESWRKHRSEQSLDMMASRKTVESFSGLSGQRGFALWFFIVGRKLDHLHLWATNEDSRARDRRKHLFRNYAARLRDELGFGRVEWFQPRELGSRKPTPESPDGHLRAVNRMKGIAGAFELKSALQNAFSKNNVIIAARTNDAQEID